MLNNVSSNTYARNTYPMPRNQLEIQRISYWQPGKYKKAILYSTNFVQKYGIL